MFRQGSTMVEMHPSNVLIGEKRRVAYSYYLGRTAKEVPGYFTNVSAHPLKPLALLPHVLDGVSRTTSDIARLFQEDKREIPRLAEHGRLYDSLAGAGSDAVGGVSDLFRGKVVSAVGKEVGAVLQVGDAITGGIADASDFVTGASADRHGSVYQRLQTESRNN